jgi:hypothetical protein
LRGIEGAIVRDRVESGSVERPHPVVLRAAIVSGLVLGDESVAGGRFGCDERLLESVLERDTPSDPVVSIELQKEGVSSAGGRRVVRTAPLAPLSSGDPVAVERCRADTQPRSGASSVRDRDADEPLREAIASRLRAPGQNDVMPALGGP